eukprot:1764784-Amphidinium_carterae.1
MFLDLWVRFFDNLVLQLLPQLCQERAGVSFPVAAFAWRGQFQPVFAPTISLIPSAQVVVSARFLRAQRALGTPSA